MESPEMRVPAKVSASTGWRWFLVRVLPLLLWMAAIFVVSHQPSSNIPSFGFWDKLLKKGGHFLAYALLALLAYRVTGTTKRPFLWALAITALYAISDELHQTFVSGREGSIADVLIDCSGGVTSLVLLRRYWFVPFRS